MFEILDIQVWFHQAWIWTKHLRYYTRSLTSLRHNHIQGIRCHAVSVSIANVFGYLCLVPQLPECE